MSRSEWTPTEGRARRRRRAARLTRVPPRPVWSSLGTASGSPVSLWRNDPSKAAGRAALRLPLGDYVAFGVDDPLAAPRAAAADDAGLDEAWDAPATLHATAAYAPQQASVLCLELADGYTFRRHRARWLRACAERLAPPPIRFKQVWHLPMGDRSVYGWAPVPPSPRFVALGHVATRGPDPPPLRAVRCVPAAWCEPRDAMRLLGHAPAWTNSSLGGRKGALWRQLHTGLLVVSRDHALNTDAPLHRLARPGAGQARDVGQLQKRLLSRAVPTRFG